MRLGTPGPLLASLFMLSLILASASLLTGATGFGPPQAAIFWQIRVPRTLLAMLIGGGLGLSGAVLQGALRNPLADPGLLGIGGTATLGAILVYYWGLSALHPAALPLGAMLGAALGCALLGLMTGRTVTGATLILAGVALSALAAAFATLALSLAPNPYALADITIWLMGSLEDRTLLHLTLTAPPTAFGALILLRLGPGLDALTLGETTAVTLGHAPARTLLLAGAGAALVVGAGAAVAGGIGFVGLVTPHLLRPFAGQRPGALLLPSLLAGAALLLAADLLARTLPLVLPLNGEPRLGVLTALLGAPFLARIARRVTA